MQGGLRATLQTTLHKARPMANKSGIQRAVEAFDGSPSKLAKAVGHGVLRQHVEHWLKIGRVSAERCPEVSFTTGISCEELNDKVNWELVRTGCSLDAAELIGEGTPAEPAKEVS